MSAHTQGPWEIHDEKKYDYICAKDTKCVIIALDPDAWYGGVSEPDAQLIAAAPDLLALAYEVADFGKYGTPLALENMALAAIAKAEGRE